MMGGIKSRPFSVPNRKSTKAKSKTCLSVSIRASFPLLTEVTRWPRDSRQTDSVLRILASSSTMRMLRGVDSFLLFIVIFCYASHFYKLY
jgi:hypothetical protein